MLLDLATRIGICRSLHTFSHYELWRTFLTELGLEVVLSPPVNRAALDLGIRVAPAEACLPVKAFLGQVALMAGDVDVVFLPRIVCRRVGRRWLFGCPKALALPDLTHAVFPWLVRAAELVVDERERPESEAFFELSALLGKSGSRRAWDRATSAAKAALEITRACGSPVHMFGEEVVCQSNPNGPRIAVVGHSYLVFDRYLNGDVLRHARAAGAQLSLLFPSPEESTRWQSSCWLPNWYYELELFAAAEHAIRHCDIDGLLLVSSFACGTAPVTNELIRRELVRGGIPTLTLLLDEHTGEAGLRTRIESFVDLLVLARRNR
ncbi:MAG: acyl-CoA dehydratase activase-related protein [candidate division WOR-3 bacterium]